MLLLLCMNVEVTGQLCEVVSPRFCGLGIWLRWLYTQWAVSLPQWFLLFVFKPAAICQVMCGHSVKHQRPEDNSCSSSFVSGLQGTCAATVGDGPVTTSLFEINGTHAWRDSWLGGSLSFLGILFPDKSLVSCIPSLAFLGLLPCCCYWDTRGFHCSSVFN